MEIEVFNFADYKNYLTEKLGGVKRRKGLRLALAKTLGCQPTYVSQVLNCKAHFSLEQAEKISRFLGHSEDEREYLFLLIQKERAGTVELQEYYAAKTGQLLAQRQILTNRLGKDIELSKEQQSVYYSSWRYAAVHIAVTIPSLQNVQALADFFKINQKNVTEVLDYLIASGIILKNKAGGYKVSQVKVRLGRNSHNIRTHHANWRQQAIESLDRETSADLHYSAVLSLSAAARLKVKNMILDALETQLAITDVSNEEELFAYNIDFFSMHK